MAASQPWYEVVTSVATAVAAIGAIGAIVVGIFTIRQRSESDARAQWWSRVQWAVDLSFEEERPRRTVGFEALALLARSPLARSGDVDFLRGLTLEPLAARGVPGGGAVRGGRRSGSGSSRARATGSRSVVTRSRRRGCGRRPTRPRACRRPRGSSRSPAPPPVTLEDHPVRRRDRDLGCRVGRSVAYSFVRLTDL